MASLVPLVLDGSVLEGGGQLLRNAVALSALLSKPITVENIRGNRKPPGLKAQHATGIRLVGEICSAQVTGATNGSRKLEFVPGPIRVPQAFTADAQTAGSTMLLLQVSLPTVVFTSSPPPGLSDPASETARDDASQDSTAEAAIAQDWPGLETKPDPTLLTLRGGTNALHAPQADYAQQVLLPFLSRHFDLSARLEVRKRGYFPRGGGELRVLLAPRRGALPPVRLTERGAITRVCGRAYVGGTLPLHVAEKIARGARAVLHRAEALAGARVEVEAVKESAHEAPVGSGSGVVLWLETAAGCFLGGSAVGVKGKDAGSLGREAAEELVRNIAHGGCVDEYLQDQIIIFMALADGESIVRTGPITLHTRTAIWVAEQICDAEFTVNEEDPAETFIRCTGIGFKGT